MTTTWVWPDDEIITAGQKVVCAEDHGLTVGDGIFETMKVIDNTPFALSRHLRRLARSAELMRCDPPDLDLVRSGIDTALNASPISYGRLRVTWTTGIGPIGTERDTTDGTLLVSAMPTKPREKHTSVVTCPWTRNPGAATAGVKSTSYADNVIALDFAHEHGASEALFANIHGDLCEGTGSNVFVVFDHNVVTPPDDCGLLQGVTRELLIEFAAAELLMIERRPIAMEQLAKADEIFLTSSTRDVQAVTELDGRPIQHGPVTSSLQRIFNQQASQHIDP